MTKVAVALVCLGLVGAFVVPLLTAQDKAPAKELLPSGVWKMENDETLDGQLKEVTNTQMWRLRVIRNRVFGQPADDKPDRARLVGDIIVGKSTIVTWRQDNSNIKGYSSFCTGRVVAKGRIVGRAMTRRGMRATSC